MPLAVMLAACLVAAGPIAAEPEVAKPLVLVHYMPWFVGRPTAPVWGWHWTMAAFDPEKVTDGKRSIASHLYPLIGPYDSADPAVVEYHFLLMKRAGIDGIVVDWYGRSNRDDYPIIHRNTAALFPVAARLGLKVAICYEDQTIPRLEKAGVIAPGDRVKEARSEIDWLRTHWFADSAYLRLNGRPVLLSFGADGLTDREWEQVLPRSDDGPIYLSEHRQRANASGAFDWPIPMEGLASLDRFAASSRSWPVAMPAAFPRFHDIYAEARVQPSYGLIPDDEGRTLTNTLERALAAKAPFLQIVTWNDWGEGTAIEPSAELGFRDLEAIQRLRRSRIDPAFKGTAEDLRLVHRLWQKRQTTPMQPAEAARLDEVARLLAIGEIQAARARLGSD